MKYNYDAGDECFIREDGAGKKFHINSAEAQRIITMRDLGYSPNRICSKIHFASGRVYESTVKNFLKNVDEGNLIVSEDYPAPRDQVIELSLEERMSRLEDEWAEFKSRIENPKPKESISEKVKEWLRN